MTMLELGEMYFTVGGVLGRRFLGTAIYMSQQIIGGGYPTPTVEQIAFANAVKVAGMSTGLTELAESAFKWGLINNGTLGASGNATSDADLQYIVGEYAKTYAA